MKITNISKTDFGKVVKVNSGMMRIMLTANGNNAHNDEFQRQVKGIFDDVPVIRKEIPPFFALRYGKKMPQSLTIVPNPYQADILQIGKEFYIVSGEERKQIDVLREEKFNQKTQAYNDATTKQYIQMYHKPIGEDENWKAIELLQQQKAKELYEEFESEVKKYISDKLEPYILGVEHNMSSAPRLTITPLNKQ